MKAPLVHRSHLLLRAEPDPQLPARVLGVLTVRNELPTRFGFACKGDEVELEIELPLRDPGATRFLADRLRRIPSVLTVETSVFGLPAELLGADAPAWNEPGPGL